MSKPKRFQLLCLAATAVIAIVISVIPVRIAIARWQAPEPQAILTLGSWLDREVFTADFASKHPNLEIWVSSGTGPEYATPIFRAFNIPDNRVHLDSRAVDTVTNFTTLVADFKSRQIQHLYLITSEFHIPRAIAIATLILGSQGITFTPVTVFPSDGTPPESWLLIARDIARSLLWIVTKRTGASLNPSLEAHR